MNKQCTKCSKSYEYTHENFYASNKTKSGLVAKCKSCANRLSKIYMRKTRIAKRLKACNLYEGTLSKLELATLTHNQLVNLLYITSRQLLYSAQSSRFCTKCEENHQNH